MDNIFEIEIVEQKEISISSFNLSAQIIVSYLNGYSCHSVKLINEPPFAGITAIDYKEDAVFIEHILKGAQLEFFAELNKAAKIQVMEAAEKLAKIIVAGTAAEAIYENGGYIDESINIKLHFLDLMKVQYLNFLLTHIDPHHTPDFIKNTIDEVLTLMATPTIWNSIDVLAGKLLEEPNQLLQNEIEVLVGQNGLHYTV